MYNFKESEILELKSKYVDSVITREIVSFLNTEGGKIYLGVEDNGNVIGVENIDIILRSLGDILTNNIEPIPSGLIKSAIINIGDKLVIEITISKGFHSLYCIKKYGFSQKGCPVRIGASCRDLTTEEIKLRYQKQFESSRDYMLQIPSGYGDISFNTMQVELQNKGYHINMLSFEENYHLRNKENDYNQLAELLSDNNNTHLIFVKFRGKDKSSISERSNYGRTSLITSYRQIRDRLIAENICMTDTTVRPRKDVYLYDIDAVMEAVINALVHNDWEINEPLISMYADRIEIISHGGLPYKQTKEKFLKGISIPRNRGLMRIFQDLEITESTGHGTLKIIKAYGEDVFDIQDTYINVVIPFNKAVLDNHNNSDDRVRKALYHKPVELLSDNEERLLAELVVNPRLTQDQLANTLNISIRTVARIIKKLQDKEYLIRVGSKKEGYWKVLK